MTTENKNEGTETNQTLEAIVNVGKKGSGFTMMAAGLGAMVAAPIIAGIVDGVQNQPSLYPGGLSALVGYASQNIIIWGNKLAGVPATNEYVPWDPNDRMLTGFEKLFTFKYETSGGITMTYRTTQYNPLGGGAMISGCLYWLSFVIANIASGNKLSK